MLLAVPLLLVFIAQTMQFSEGCASNNIPKGYDDYVKESKTGIVEITGDAGRIEFVGLWYDRKSGT